MNREEILAMQPGPILEYYVALKVMGFSPSALRDGWVKIGSLATYPKRYSTDISAAWEVVKKLDDSHYIEIHTDEYNLNKWHCRIDGSTKGFGETAPEAICKAALLAIIEGEETK